MAKKTVKVDVSNIDENIELESIEDVIEEHPQKKQQSNVYKDALETVIKMIKSGTHVENIMKYIESILK